MPSANLSYADLMAQFAPAPYMDADGIWQTPVTGTVNVPGLGDVIFIPRGTTGPAPLFTDPVSDESYWLMPAPDGSVAFEFIPHAKDQGLFSDPLFTLIGIAAVVYTGGAALGYWGAAAETAVASGAVSAETAAMIADNAAYAAWAGGDAATVAATTAYNAGMTAEAVAAAASAASGGGATAVSLFDGFASGLAEDAGLSQAAFEAANLQAGLTASGASLTAGDVVRVVNETRNAFESGLAEDAGVSTAELEAANLRAGLTASGLPISTITQAATTAAVKAATGGALTTAGGLLTTAATIAKMIKGATTPANPGVNPATGLPWTVDTSTANAQSISQMLPWLAIAAFGVIALKGK